MSNDEHRKLATTIKNIHKDLRNLSSQIGPEKAWKKHLEDEDKLKLYAQSMRELAESHWTSNVSSQDRIQWAANFCDEYFQTEALERWKQKDLRVFEWLKVDGLEIQVLDEELTLTVNGNLEALDVGSSGNFFRSCQRLNILPIDISPSDDSVYICDFLEVPVASALQIQGRKVEALQSNHFHVVFFCLLLEYLPSSIQRIESCKKAYKVLQSQGILIIITPDSSHEMKNSKQIKNWRWTLAQIGFQRVKVEKLRNLTCMAFRKSLAPEIPQRWANQHKEPYMNFELKIPQDKPTTNVHDEQIDFDASLMSELPFE